jgi:hypothetical protein
MSLSTLFHAESEQTVERIKASGKLAEASKEEKRA